MTAPTMEQVDAFAEILRREKTPEARVALAVAAVLSLEPDDKAHFMDWCGTYAPGILSWRTAA